MIYFQLAWRNIWRNKRRSFITIASVLFAVVLAILMKSMIAGVWGKMVKDVVSFSSGYIQIHQKGYWDEQSIENLLEEKPEIYQVLNNMEEISSFSPRLESFCLASNGEKTLGSLLQGVNPEMENNSTQIAKKIIKGNYFKESENQILIAEGLSKRLNLKINDTLILLGQGFQGNVAAGKFSIKAIIHLGVVELNNTMIWMPLKTCQNFFSATNLISSISLMLTSEKKMEIVKIKLKAKLNSSELEIMNWKEMLPELEQMVEADSSAHFLVIYILYFVISFGIFGTLLMMLNERQHEFGILLAIGIKKKILNFICIIEILIISIMGTIAGILFSIPLLLYLKNHPIRFTGEIAKVYEGFGMEAILPPSIEYEIFLSQAYSILILVGIISIYPAIKISRMKTIDALNS